jgi:gamma-glutamyltranspeptidase/glutathione hydrolase
MYLGPDGSLIKGQGSSITGWRASGVPGSVAGFALALEKYGSGKVSWADVCEPSRRLAADGHIVSQATAAGLRRSTNLPLFAESKRVYLNEGRFYQIGELWRQPDLAATFARLQQHGPREFYEGETAQKIVAAMAANGGTITAADLKNYRVAVREPLRGTYRGYDIVTMPPPSSAASRSCRCSRCWSRTMSARWVPTPPRNTICSTRSCAAHFAIARNTWAIPTSCRFQPPGCSTRPTSPAS